jgi:phage terminase small subunit
VGGLSAKRRAFLEAYLSCWNATEAARRTGYKHPHVQGPRLLANVRVQVAIQARLTEIKMNADEVLVRLAQQARSEYSAYIRDGGTIDLARLLADGKGHLVKGAKWDRSGKLVVEFYDGQHALELLGKHLGLFKDGVQVDISDALAGILARLAGQSSRTDD